MSETPVSPTPAGWYDSGDGRKRWWNGLEWTDDYQQPKKKIRTPLWVTVVAGVVALLLGVAIGGGGRSDSAKVESLEAQVAELREDNAALRDQNSPSDDPEVSEPVAEEPATSALTLGQKQAIAQAESYLDFAAFSRTGLIEQLEYEGFSTADATFAVDNITVDWNEQAAASAESYLEFTSFSRSGLIEQLIYEGFTPEQAEFGVTAVGY
jgi:hypothetical protein